MALKWSRGAFALAISVLNLGITFVDFLIFHYVPDQALAGAATVFLTGVANATIVYLGTEEQKAAP